MTLIFRRAMNCAVLLFTSEEERFAKEWIDLYEILPKHPGGDVSLVRPDNTVLGPLDAGESIAGPWGVAIDGNENVRIANSTGRSITQLCGARIEACPPGLKTGDPISPHWRCPRRAAPRRQLGSSARQWCKASRTNPSQ